jgi:glycosyltransferase involved in cell wall biosynthesis
MDPQITLLIPTFNRKALLKRAIESGLAQTYKNIRIAVFDNASDDGTERLMLSYAASDPRIQYYRHSENIGMMKNYEFALKKVNTPYFSILSDDDVLLPWFYETALEKFKKYPEIGFCACCTVAMTEEGKVISVPFLLWNEGIYESRATELIGKYPIPTGILFNTKVLENVPIDLSNPLVWDCEFILHIAAIFPFYMHTKTSAIFVVHEKSYSNVAGPKAWQKGIEKMIENTRFFPKENRLQIKEALEEYLPISVYKNTVHSLLNKRYLNVFEGSQILKSEFNQKIKANILKFLATCCSLFYPCFCVLKILQKIKRRCNKAKIHKRQLKYKKFHIWLKNPLEGA